MGSYISRLGNHTIQSISFGSFGFVVKFCRMLSKFWITFYGRKRTYFVDPTFESGNVTHRPLRRHRQPRLQWVATAAAAVWSVGFGCLTAFSIPPTPPLTIPLCPHTKPHHPHPTHPEITCSSAPSFRVPTARWPGASLATQTCARPVSTLTW